MKLKEYLMHHRIRYKDFAVAINVSKSTLWNIITRGDCMLHTALTIEKETNGAVKCKDLLLTEKKIKDKCELKTHQTLDDPVNDGIDQKKCACAANGGKEITA